MTHLRLLIPLTLLCMTAAAQPTIIDSLQTSSQLEAFVRRFDTRDDSTTFMPHTHSILTDLSPKKVDSFGAVAYEKGDFDGNGTTDLLFNGYSNVYPNNHDYPKTGVILSFGRDSFQCTDLTRIGTHYMVAKKLVIAGHDYLEILAHRPYYNYRWDHPLPDIVDTLRYVDGCWLDHAERPQQHSFQEIKFCFGGGLGNLTKYRLIIRGNIVKKEMQQFNSDASNEWSADSTCTLTPTISRKLYDLLNTVDFPGLQDSYEVSGTDNSSSSLRIDYDQEQFKLIQDYGLRGTFGLVAIYQLMAEIVTTQHWKSLHIRDKYGPGSCEEGPNPEIKTTYNLDEGNGIHIAIRRIATKARRPHARTILLIHGGGSGGVASFDSPSGNAPSFADGLFRKNFNVYIMDVRGWENSTAPAYDSTDTSLVAGSCQEAAEDIDAVVNYIRKNEHLEKVNLFGWATGGHWASYYTTLHNDKVDHLIVLNTLYGVKGPWSLNSAFADSADSNRYNVHIPLYRESSRQAVIDSRYTAIPSFNRTNYIPTASVEIYADQATSWNPQHTLRVPGGYRRESFNMAHGYQYWNAKAIKCPTLIIRSQYDFWSRPIDVTAFYNDLTNAPRRQTLELPDATHFAFLDGPRHGRDALLTAIDNFIPRPR